VLGSHGALLSGPRGFWASSSNGRGSGRAQNRSGVHRQAQSLAEYGKRDGIEGSLNDDAYP